MRNRNWDQDFDEINQSNVNRFHTNRDGQRQYDSGYSNPYGQTSYEQHMSRRDQRGHRNRNDNSHDWANNSNNRYNPYRQDERARGGQSGADYDDRRMLHSHHPDEAANDHRGFFRNMGERVGEFIHEGRERVEHLFDRFGNRHDSYREDRNHNPQHNYGRFGNENQQHSHQGRIANQQFYGNRIPDPDGNWHKPSPRSGYEHTRYYQGNQGHVQGNRYDADDYSARSSYRLTDSNSGYGQNMGYASDRDDE